MPSINGMITNESKWLVADWASMTIDLRRQSLKFYEQQTALTDQRKEMNILYKIR